MPAGFSSPPHQDAVRDLLARGSFARAVSVLRAQLERRPKAVSLRLQLADVLLRASRKGEATELLEGLADDLGRAGLAAQAIAVMKRVQEIAPERGPGAERLAGAIQDGREARGVPPTGPQPLVEPGPPPPEVSLLDTLHALTPLPAAENPLFQSLSGSELVEVIKGLRQVDYEPGDIIVTEGEPGDSLFILTLGEVKAFARRPDGSSALIRRLREGDFFGEVSVVRGGPRTATVTAAARCEMLVLDRATVTRITATHPHVGRVLQDICDLRSGLDPSPSHA